MSTIALLFFPGLLLLMTGIMFGEGFEARMFNVAALLYLVVGLLSL